jgi:hypothetical protein
MMKNNFTYNKWSVIYTPEDGGRLDRLSYAGFDLLTSEPEKFKPPTEDYGLYEKRPVYGYDDCFPSVEPCTYPGMEWEVPDHGEVCYLPFQVNDESDRLIFTVKSQVLPIQLRRELRFKEDVLIWDFEVTNKGVNTIPFQHVIHPLMPLNTVASIDLPQFGSVYDAILDENLKLKDPVEVQKYLLDQEQGTANMLFLQNLKDDSLSLGFINGMQLKIAYQSKYFSALGIWWNNSGYPDEDGCRRNECAFEPIPGLTSKLSDAFSNGTCLSVAAGQKLNWQIIWTIKEG